MLYFFMVIIQSFLFFSFLFIIFLRMIGLREWFAQTDERTAPPRIPVMVNMASSTVSSQKSLKAQGSTVHASSSIDQMNAANRNSVLLDEYSDEDEEYQIPESEQEVQVSNFRWYSLWLSFSNI